MSTTTSATPNKTVLTATFTRQIQPKQYETASAGYTMVCEYDTALDADETAVAMANMTLQLKTRVFAELGLPAEVGEDGILVELARTFPGAKIVDSGGDGPFDEERPRTSRTGRGSSAGRGSSSRGGSSRGGSGKLSKEDAERYWEDFMGDGKNDFYDNLDDDEPNIKHKKSGQKLYLKYAPQWVKDDLED